MGASALVALGLSRGTRVAQPERAMQTTLRRVAPFAVLILVAGTGCTTLGPVPGMTAVNAVPAPGADVEAQVVDGRALGASGRLALLEDDHRARQQQGVQRADARRSRAEALDLYRESADGPFRVTYVEARDLDMSKVASDDCLRSLRVARRNRAS